MAKAPRPDLVGASETSIAVQRHHHTTTRVTFHQPARQAVLARVGTSRPVNAFLNLENVTGSGLHGSYEVYVDVPQTDATPAGHKPLLAGHLSTFGVRAASMADGPHAGSGNTTVLDVTKQIHALHSEHGWDGQHLDVTLVPKIVGSQKPDQTPSDLKIGRVSVYYS
jgi:tyrosinase